MSALAAPSTRKIMEEPTIRSYPMAAVKAYQGGLAVLASGFCRPGYVATGLVAVGIFDFSGDVMEGTMDNSGGSPGDLNARVREGTFLFANYGSDPVVAADRGSPCFIFDDNTVAHSDGSAARSVAGTVVGLEGSTGVWVRVGSVNGTSLAAEIAARQAVTTALALATTPGGASLVGVYDAAAKLTATTVEAALAENIDARRIALGTDGNTLPVPQVMISKTIANSAGDTDITLNSTYGGIRVTSVIVEKAAGSSTGGDATITVKNTATAITEAMALSGLTAGLVFRNTLCVPAAASIASGGILRISAAKSTGDAACTVTVYGYRIA